MDSPDQERMTDASDNPLSELIISLLDEWQNGGYVATPAELRPGNSLKDETIRAKLLAEMERLSHTKRLVIGHPIAPAVEFPPAIRGYSMIGELGRGGMGVVYRARCNKTNTDIAIKILWPGADQAIKGRWEQEVEAGKSVQHPNVLRVLDSGEAGDRLFVVTPYVSGGTLREYADHDPLPPNEVAAIVRAVALGVQAVHKSGRIHRDIKPSNILFEVLLPGMDDVTNPSMVLLSKGLPQRSDQLNRGSVWVIPKLNNGPGKS